MGEEGAEGGQEELQGEEQQVALERDRGGSNEGGVGVEKCLTFYIKCDL